MIGYKGKVVITTFFYKETTNRGYSQSLAATTALLEKLGIRYDYWAINGNYHMELVIGNHLGKVLKDPEATDVINIDSDESWNPESLVRLLMHDVDVVCGAYRQVKKEVTFPIRLVMAEDGSHMGKLLPDGNCLLEADMIPFGFTRVSKRALQAWVDHNPDKWAWDGENKVPLFFYNEVIDHIFHGMDFVFSRDLKRAGMEIWVDPMCDIGHWGPEEYRGTMDSHLRKLKQVQEAGGDAFDIVKKMADEVNAKEGWG